MFIIEMSYYESDFCKKSTRATGAYKVRTFDVDHQFSLFVYYFEEYTRLTLRKYGAGEVTEDDWDRIQAVGLLRPDVRLDEVDDVWINAEERQLHVQVPAKTRWKE